MPTLRLLLLVPALILTGFVLLPAQPEQPPYNPSINPASDQGEKAIARFKIPAGFKVDLWAAEPLLANPVCFCFDEKGRCYVAETFRLHAGVTDIRNHMDWLDDDLASRTVDDRVEMMKRRDGKNFKSYGIHHDRVRLLEDTKGTGKADKATVFADGFNHIPDGIGAGLVARRGKVWYTCIPDLWVLQDTKGTGTADVKKSLSHGYGIHVGFLGHDLHGLRFGPDGKLYFSLGDRGLSVKTPDGLLDNPDTGAVLRCNPDGSELELFHVGLRNPQELAFDDFGNLFTMDNNSDSGDRVRWVHLIEGGDSGWRIGYQFGTPYGDRGPWNTEKMWHPRWDGQPAWIVPPLANLGDGPSGLTHYPGTGFTDKYKGHFFLADFRGGPGNSGVRTFKNEPAGASFKFVDGGQFLWNILPTDVDFGYDGGLYVADWVDGWGLPKKGRLYKITDPEGQKNPAVAEVKKLFAEGFEQRSAEELAKLLGHVDQRVRQEAQFALAERGKASAEVLAGMARANPSVLARVHAIWGLGQINQQVPVGKELVALTKDSEDEVRTAALRVLGDRKIEMGVPALTAALKDASPRVRLYAALGLARLGSKESLPAVVEMLRENNDKDAYLRHAGVMALSATKDETAITALGKDPLPSVRLAAVLALRRLGSLHVGDFLSDATPLVVAEAARAINDAPILPAMPNLAALIRRQGLPNEVMFRVLNACFRIGTPEMAKEVATFAARSDAPEALRVEAVKCLGDWTKPSGRDRILGIWRPLPERAPEVAASAFKSAVGGIFTGPAKVREEAVKVSVKLGIKEVGPLLAEIVKDTKLPGRVRVEALLALDTLKHATVGEVTQTALGDAEPRLRAAARSVLAKKDPMAAFELSTRALQNGETVEKQSALTLLGELKVAGAEPVLKDWLERFDAGKVTPALQLELLEAAGKRPEPGFKEWVAKFEASRASKDKVAQYRESLEGGDAAAGREVFFNKAAVSCLRCHKVGSDGGEVGPNLSEIGSKQKRDYLLESIVDPNKVIAQGFETVILVMNSGKTVAGIIKAETPTEITLINPDGQLINVRKADVDERQKGKSPMPEDVVKHLSRRELRDLVEYLSTLRKPN
jgi:quinoprotein glucose dehydrogenase